MGGRGEDDGGREQEGKRRRVRGGIGKGGEDEGRERWKVRRGRKEKESERRNR